MTGYTSPSSSGVSSARAATAAMSAGSTVATGTPPHGPRTTSPARSCGSHWVVLDMNVRGRRIVCGNPDSVTAFSEPTL